MAKKLKVGDAIHGYRITKVFGPGMMAISYGAVRAATGEKVFFKQYKSPAPTVVWYRAFVDYQKELSRACATAGGPLRGAPGRRVRGGLGRPLLLPGLRVRGERRRPAAVLDDERERAPASGRRRSRTRPCGRGTSPGRRC
jgi:hypothetical protein